jgi:hypothetical protein
VPQLVARDSREDLDNPIYDWPERVARTTFEIGQSLLWQGRYIDADDVCRTGYMRIAGAKWAAWDDMIKGVVRFAERDFSEAERLLTASIALLQAEGFEDFTPTIRCALAACRRAQGEVVRAREVLAKAEKARQTPGTAAAVLAERAEWALATGGHTAAIDDFRRLSRSSLPLWSGVGHLRRAELGIDPEVHAADALAQFGAVQSQWGLLRTRALTGDVTDNDLGELTRRLGPTDTFRPNALWLF